MKFNCLQFNPLIKKIEVSKYALEPLSVNSIYDSLLGEYKTKFSLNKVKNISFSKEGLFALIRKLKGKIAISLGESEYIVQAGLMAKEFGLDISFININKDGTLEEKDLDKYDFIFISSYIIDTYIKVDIKSIKEKTKAKLISNASANMSLHSDIYLLDSYKLCGLGGMGVVIYEDEFEEQSISQINLLALDLSLKALNNQSINLDLKYKFLDEFKKQFKDDLYLFVDENKTLEYTLHIGLKGIKMREIIRTLALENIFLSNGEGCSLGLLKPSRVLQEMGYKENEARWGLSLDFSEELDDETIKNVVKKINKKYRQIKVLG
ncbi:MAG: cysteine desulfurase [Halarcobacter sp.]